MISRRNIRIRVMQAIYAWYSTEDTPGDCFELNLKDFAEEIRKVELEKGDKGDSRLLTLLFYETIKSHKDYDLMIASKADNWEIERIALLDRILMEMGICEILNFEEVPVKVSINEYLEIAKQFSTPKSSKFINGILDSLYIDFKESGRFKKSGRGLIEESLPKAHPKPRTGGPKGPGFKQDGPRQFKPRDENQQGSSFPRQEKPRSFPPSTPPATPPADGDSPRQKRPRIRKSDSGTQQ